MDNSTSIIRYISTPTKLDCYPYGTICYVQKNDEGTESDIYIQSSISQEAPEWISAPELLEYVFSPYLKDPQFIKNLLSLHAKKESVDSIMPTNSR